VQHRGYCGLYLRLSPHSVPHQPHQQATVDAISCHEQCHARCPRPSGLIRLQFGAQLGVDTETGLPPRSHVARFTHCTSKIIVDRPSHGLPVGLWPKWITMTTSQQPCSSMH
jgi:hypothetical protein